MTIDEVIWFCDTHECEDCPCFWSIDCRTKYEKQEQHIPCQMNLLECEV